MGIQGFRSWRHRGVAFAFVLSAAAVGVHDQTHPGADYSRFDLPDFDPWVYMAMAEHPSVFTLTPWGHRTLKPWLLHVLGDSNRELRVDRYVNAVGLTAAGALFFLFLRRRGHGEAAALLALVVFLLTDPFMALFDEPLLTDPISLPLTLGLLLAVEAGAGAAILALLFVLGTHSKELFVLFLPLVYLSRRGQGTVVALRTLALVALPTLVVVLTLRFWWTPYVRAPHVPYDLDAIRSVGAAFQHGWTAYPGAILLWGATPLAMLGALRPAARPFLERYGYLAAVTLVAPFVAFLNAPRAVAAPYVVPRHMIYAAPFVLPLALLALDRFWRNTGTPLPPPVGRPLWRGMAALATAAVLVFPFAALDRYRRAPLHDPLVGPLILTTCRESLRTARALAAGREVVWDIDHTGWTWGRSDPGAMSQMRWFLREGWGRFPWSQTGEARMESAEASVLLPTFGGSGLDVHLTLSAPAEMLLGIAVNGRPLDGLAVTPDPQERAVRILPGLLFRGDNVLTLQRSDGGGAPRLHRLVIRPVSGRSGP
jgi:hypothetical protein